MKPCCTFFKSSIGKKIIMAGTGLGLSGFVLTHMLGNLLIFVSPEAYNRYSHQLITNPFIYVAEMGLLALFVAHIILAFKLTHENRNARKNRYAMNPNGEKEASIASRTLIWTGSLVLVFTILHLITFKYGPEYSVAYDGVEMRDLYQLVLEVFQNPIYVAWYLVCMVILGIHLSHGFSSMFQSLGINHPKYNCAIKIIGWAYAVIVAVGFISQPLYVFLFGNNI